jgi:hypothetical protein
MSKVRVYEKTGHKKMKQHISTLNKEWHLTHRMPANATLTQRIAWHIAHKKNCSCRDIPEKLKAEMNKKGIRL